jgi:Tfp pilus tip-associated adhesin PilY1
MSRNILTLLVTIIFVSSQSLAKSPPPGTGFQDVPTNVLIMLDTSGSMAWSASGAETDYPYDMVFDSAGNRFVASYYSVIEKYDSSNNFVTNWGSYDSGGKTDGKFRYIYGIDIDSDDKLYVSDYARGRVQVFDTDGNYLSQFNVSTSYSRGIAIDRSDPSNNRIYVVNGDGDIEVYNTSGAMLTSWSVDSDAYGIAVDKASPANVYVTLRSDEEVHKFDSVGNPVNSFDGGTKNYFKAGLSSNGYTDPHGIDVDSVGNIYIGDRGSPYSVYKYNSAGVLQVSYGGYGSSLGEFSNIRGLYVDPTDEVWVADAGNDRIQKFDGSEEWPGSNESRLSQAKKVIKDIVSNSTLTDGADFGLLEWNNGNGGDTNVIVPISNSGASTIYNTIDSLSAGGGTYLDFAMATANSYLHSNGYLNNKNWCQKTVLIVISDGEWVDNSASALAEQMYNNAGVKTFVVGFTVSASSSGAANYVTIAQKGGTYPDSPVFANDWQTLYESISDYILQTINSTLTFSTPTIMPEVTGNDHIIQATFKYKTAHQWKGSLNKYELNADGTVGSLEWDAGEVLATTAAADRNIWTVGDGLTANDYNNFVLTNLDELRVPLLENTGTSYTDPELEGLIDFVRGIDTYNEFSGGVDDEGDTIITGERWKLADVYHSRAVSVGVPSAFTSELANSKTEAYYRYINGYNTFKNVDAATRDSVIYVGSNGGMLHAFDSADGSEKWAFIPPSVIPNFKDMISNTASESKSIYGVDGSPVVKDIYYGGQWRTVLMVGARQGGHAYSALDVTDPDAPSHLFTFAYNKINDEVSYWNASGARTDYDASGTIPSEYDFSDLGEAWSKPLILKVPVGAGGAMKWTAVFGGGFNAGIDPTYGARLFIVDLEDGGKIINKLTIADDDSSNGIENSIPSRLMAITPDSSTFFQEPTDPNGAIIYFSDLEGKLWKINLTDQGTLYETARLFDAESDSDNTRLMFHEHSASVDAQGNLWQYYGSGDQQSLGDIDSDIANRGYAYKYSPAMVDPDPTVDFAPSVMETIADMANVSDGDCPEDDESGWYINLDSNEKITSKASVSNGYVYFSRYTPNSSDICSSGTAKISEHSYSCGAIEAEFDLGYGVPTESILYKNKIYLGISTDQVTTSLPAGWVKSGNLIIGTPSELATGKVEIESWWEDF